MALVLMSCATNKKVDMSVSTAPGFKLGQLVPIYVSATTDIVVMPVDQLLASYKDLLNYVSDEELIANISARIADLELVLQDQLVAKSEEKGDGSYVPDYSLAIKAYNDVLKRYPDRKDNDRLYYQLAKGYDMSGNASMALKTLTTLIQKYPDTQYFVEAQFRRGDHLFSQRQYKEAQDAYKSVFDKGKDTPFFENAVYMHAWTLFKRSFYEPSIESFTLVLDRTMPRDGRIEGVDKNKMALVEDSLRMMGMIFSYLDGGETITRMYSELGGRAYEGLLYERLGDLYVSQQRYQDAINTYQEYMNRNPLGIKVPELHNKILQTMHRARFYNREFAEKEKFIELYRLGGEYSNRSDQQTREYVQEYLYAYIDEVARFYHARAQKAKVQWQSAKDPIAAKKQMQNDYETARKYYIRFVEDFPSDVHVPEKIFMMAEVLSEIGDFKEAVKAYERVAYDYGISNFSEDAAYASILTYKKLIKDEVKEDEKANLLKRKLTAQMAFIDNFGFSKYSRPLLLDSIDMMYVDKDYQAVIQQSNRYLAMNSEVLPENLLTVSLVMGHSYFELGQYADSEAAYQKTLQLMDGKDVRRSDVTDRIAACVYKQAEALVAEGKKTEAIEEFLRVSKVSPNSKFRKNADFDAITYLLQEEKWERSLELLKTYREMYDPKMDSLDISSKLLAAYEGLQRFDLAAAELTRVTALTQDPEKKRQAMFLTAEYYEKSGDNVSAIKMFRDYVNKYPKPFDLAMETRYRLSEMYRKNNDEYRYRFWLESIIKSDDDAGKERTERSKYLAVYARNIFAADYLKEFKEIKLTLPLKKSLAKKKKALDAALKRYEKILDYGVQEFSTQATFYVADIYALLSVDLMQSERPKGLSELELEQYTILLEEQAYPFEEKSIEIHESNVENGRNGSFDKWVSKSIETLARLLPGRYDKKEDQVGYSDVVY